jgi:hypothetical protein
MTGSGFDCCESARRRGWGEGCGKRPEPGCKRHPRGQRDSNRAPARVVVVEAQRVLGLGQQHSATSAPEVELELGSLLL